ncbi:MAG TPA: restriction endonuclease [Candidatus Baltobacteraceae bacterium]|jgi:restriction system protein|nr:restriction endonuclease [Candidatus Baltobacteraceae bacterium]
MPTYEDLLLPILKLIADGSEHRMHDLSEILAAQFHLTADDRAELLSGGQPRFINRMGWARTALKKACLLESPRRACVQITARGRELLSSGIEILSDKYLLRFPEYLEYKGMAGDGSPSATLHLASTPETTATPQERLEQAYTELSEALAQDILAKVKSCSPSFFEQLVVDLLVKMGYGGSRRDAGSAVGRSGDGGIDGVIKEDELGLDMIYLQAKRYTTANVPSGDVRDFVGALVGKRARKGVFLTTSGFQEDARLQAQDFDGRSLVLIDGKMLAHLMLKYEIGFSITNTYKVGRIDEDYFEEEIAG